MDLIKEFEAYLPRWSDEKHLPIPTKAYMKRWYAAWNDFVKEELSKRWESLRDEYLALELATPQTVIKNSGQVQVESDIVEQESVPLKITQEQSEKQSEKQPTNEWEKVEKLMKDL